ncbi:hypothetical protein [Nocardiopsis aegyptia]|uniref:Uncharacterized protein n=1 Tax=Nocardiopsis aegyptia TaxID=220378 RepID=A0A7Z0EQ52_9ACTN|nr:hypothetical protein [Nocardiopsis aegyptia]NYJ35661.1 hypothetical protein [Nocardiopsis aegyptia]
MARCVRIDMDAVIEMQNSLVRIVNSFANEDVESPEERAEDIGPGNLVDKAKDYGKDCKKNYERQSEDLNALLKALTPVIESFQETDDELGRSLTDDKACAPPARRDQPV